VIRRLTYIGAVALCAGWPTPLLAQDTLTVAEAVRQTLAGNRLLQSAQAGVRESDARTTQARAGFFPRVSFVESWQRGDQPVFVFSSLLSSRRFGASNFAVDALNAPDPVGFFHGAVSVEQMLFDGGRTRGAVESARLEHDMAMSSADDTAASLAVAAVQTFGRLLTAQAAERAARGASTAAREDLARAERRRDAGTMSEADVLAMNVRLAEMEQRRIQAASEADSARVELNRLMGSPVEREYTVQEPTPAPPSIAETTNVKALFAEVEAARPDLRRAAAAERLADAGYRQARGGWYPQIAAQAGYETNGTRFNDRASSWVVGGELRWTLSVGGAESARVKGAAEATARARLEHEDARAAAYAGILDAIGRLNSARARQVVGQAAVSQAREAERIVRDRFDAGIASVTDVLRASAATFDAEAQRVSALVDALVAEAALGRALGRKPS
jgi:outer membrane protein